MIEFRQPIVNLSKHLLSEKSLCVHLSTAQLKKGLKLGYITDMTHLSTIEINRLMNLSEN
jgi:hypothetical protein